MAILTTSKAHTVRLVYTGDPAVVLTAEAAERRLTQAKLKHIRAALADVPSTASDDARAAAETEARAAADKLTVPRVWVNSSECTKLDGATVATIRALSWLEDQEAKGLEAGAQIARFVELGLVEIDGNTDAAKAFKADPPAPLYVPLYHAIAELTWGNW